MNKFDQNVIGTQKYSIPPLPFPIVGIHLKFASPISEDKIYETVCEVEDLVGLRFKKLVKSEHGVRCGTSTPQRRRMRLLQSKNSFVIIVEQDPFKATLKTSISVLNIVNDPNFVVNLSKRIFGVTITSIQGFEVSTRPETVGIIPDFTPSTSIVHTKNITSISFTFKVTNTDAMLWVGYIRSNLTVKAPNTLEELKKSTSLEKVLSVFLNQNKDTLLTDKFSK